MVFGILSKAFQQGYKDNQSLYAVSNSGKLSENFLE
jgi:hypothetical protein